ncbi:hypothetical protein GCM10009106_13870 [Sphingomonas japonica]
MAAIAAEANAPAIVVAPEGAAAVAAPAAVAAAPVAMVPGTAAPMVQDSAVTTTTQESTSTTTPDPVTGEAETTTTTTAVQNTVYDDSADSEATDYTPFIVGGVLLAGGILALALSGDDDDEDNGGTPAPTPTPTPTPTNAEPVFTSAATATVAENSATDTVVYTAVATDADDDDITYALSGDDAALFAIDADTGEVTLLASADFEEMAEYNITVTASDGTDTVSQDVVVTVTDVNDAPTFATATATVAIDENVDVGTVVFDADATDTDADSMISYSLTGADADAFTIDEDTGEVRFVASPDFEGQDTYDFTVVATDDGDPGLTAEQAVTVTINDLDDVVTESLDVEGVVVSGAAGDVQFEDDADVLTDVTITDFAEGDTVVVTGTDGADIGSSYSFSSLDNDLIIDFSGGGASNRIIIEDAVSADDFIFNEETAEAAVGFDFFSYA